MSRLSELITALVLVLATSLGAYSQYASDKSIPTLTYSDLFANKDRYLGQSVRVIGYHIYGFEWSFLCDSDCSERKTDTWVEFVDEHEMCKGSKGKLKKGSDKFDNKASVVYVGKLSAGSFGHFGAYEYQFTVQCVEKFRKLPIPLK